MAIKYCKICGKLLSSYNKTDQCFSHSGWEIANDYKKLTCGNLHNGIMIMEYGWNGFVHYNTSITT